MAELDNDRFVTRKKFRELCSPEKPIANTTLQTAIRGGKVIITKQDGHHLIDLENITNKEYLAKKQNEQVQQISLDFSEIDRRKKELELDTKLKDNQLKDIQLQKAMGEVIPTALVAIVLKSHMKEVQQQLFYACERIATDTVKKLGGTKKEIANVKGELVAVLNNTMKNARESSAQQVSNMVQEYQTTKMKKSA